MQLGDILIGRGLVSAADIEAALARQLTEGGRLGDNLIAMGLLTAEQLATVITSKRHASVERLRCRYAF